MKEDEVIEIEQEEVAEESQVQDTEESGDTPEDIERAKKLGFKTDEEYKGNPKYKLSAREYLERAEKGGTIKKLESDINEMRTAFEKMQQFTRLQVETAKEKALEELRIKQIKSVDEDGVSAAVAFDNYERDKQKVEKQYNTVEPIAQRREPPEVIKFYEENPWYHEDVVMRGAADALSREIAASHPHLSNSEHLEKVKSKIVERFSDKFENPRRKVQSIEGGRSVHGAITQNRVTFQSLGFSNSDIEDARKLIKAGTFKDEADFIKSYTLLNKGKR